MKEYPNLNENMLPEKVKENYWFWPETMYYICGIIYENLKWATKQSMALQVLYQLLITLHFVGTGAYYKVTADTFSASKSTVSKVVRVVTFEIIKLSYREIVFPSQTALVNVKSINGIW